MISALTLSTALMLAGLVITYLIHAGREPSIVVESGLAPDDLPLISVCIPARNEARTIARCLQAVMGQTYSPFEVIVIDDESTDSTPDILAKLASMYPELTMRRAAPLPTDWAGKTHALDQASRLARGAWLCFLDADTILGPEALLACYAKAKATAADLFTILTRQDTVTFWEKVLMPIVFTALSVGFSPRRVNDPRLPDAIANGRFMLIRRDVYELVGGHAAIRDQIVDDKALADRVKRSGQRLVLADGRSVASTRMYTSLPEMWEGWTKNIYLGLRDRPRTLMLGAVGAVLLVAAALWLPLWTIIGIKWSVGGGGWIAWSIVTESLVVWADVLFARGAAAASMGISRLYALTTPLGSAVFAAMMLVSTWNVLSGHGVMWRGRIYRGT